MNRKLMSTLSLLFALSLLFSVAVSANTPGQGKGKGNATTEETVEQEETDETTTDDETTETDEATDEETDENEELEEGEKQKGKGKGKGLQRALENVKGLPSEQIIAALLAGNMDVSEVAQGLQELADEEGDEVSDQELKEVTDELRDYVEEEELEAEQELELMGQMVDIYEKVGALDDAIEVQEGSLKKNYKDLEAYKKLGKLKEGKGNNGNAGGKGIVAFVNGEETNSDVAPMAKDGRTFLPFRAISQSLKADVSWNEEEKSVTVTRDGVEVTLVIGSTTAYVNGQEITLDAPPEIIAGRTVVPVRFIAEAFGAIVQWEAESNSVVIYEEDTTQVNTTEETTTEETTTESTTTE
jgi:hypothetical protein